MPLHPPWAFCYLTEGHLKSLRAPMIGAKRLKLRGQSDLCQPPGRLAVGSQGRSCPAPGTSPSIGALRHTASFSLIPGDWVCESPGQGVLGCCASRILSTPPTSFLWPQSSLCTSSPAHPTFLPWGHYCAGLFIWKASQLHPGVAIHLGSHLCPFQPEAPLGL